MGSGPHHLWLRGRPLWPGAPGTELARAARLPARPRPPRLPAAGRTDRGTPPHRRRGRRFGFAAAPFQHSDGLRRIAQEYLGKRRRGSHHARGGDGPHPNARHRGRRAGGALPSQRYVSSRASRSRMDWPAWRIAASRPTAPPVSAPWRTAAGTPPRRWWTSSPGRNQKRTTDTPLF